MFDDNYNYAVSRIMNTYMITTGRKLEYLSESSCPDNCLHKAVFRTVNSDGVANLRVINEFVYPIVSIGYCCINDSSCYIARTPLREDWKQGIRAKQFCIKYLSARGNINQTNISDSCFRKNIKEIEKSIRGEYQKLDGKLLERVEETGMSRHFSRDYCINAKFKLEYRGQPIGYLNNKMTLVVEKKYSFLTDQLAGITQNYEVA